MAKIQAATHSYDDEAAAHYQDIYLRIEGLFSTSSDGVFRLEGVRPQSIDAEQVEKGFGYIDGRRMPEDLMEEICELVLRRQLVEVLASRVRREG